MRVRSTASAIAVAGADVAMSGAQAADRPKEAAGDEMVIG